MISVEALINNTALAFSHSSDEPVSFFSLGQATDEDTFAVGQPFSLTSARQHVGLPLKIYI